MNIDVYIETSGISIPIASGSIIDQLSALDRAKS